jgi:drug/metabolite transporter (DMT)-like permease
LADSADSRSELWLAVVPVVFLLFWSTGFIVAKYAAPHAPPLTFLVWRFAGVLIVLLPLLLITRPEWPAAPRQWLAVMAAGLLLQAGYLGGVWWAIDRGMPAGLCALIVGLQPLATALLAGSVGERLDRRQWLGMAFGLAGITLVLSDRLTLQGVGPAVLGANVLALVSITLGTLVQKRHCGGVDLRAATTIQFVAALLVIAPLALLTESRSVQHTVEFWLALLWSILVLSLAAMVLLLGMIRRGRATSVASLMYLTPPLTSLLAWMLFDERLGAGAVLGLLVTMAGVGLVLRGARATRTAVRG